MKFFNLITAIVFITLTYKGANAVYIVETDEHIRDEQVTNNNARYPHVGYVQVVSKSDNESLSKNSFGTGTFISENLFITALHTICSGKSSENPSQTLIERKLTLDQVNITIHVNNDKFVVNNIFTCDEVENIVSCTGNVLPGNPLSNYDVAILKINGCFTSPDPNFKWPQVIPTLAFDDRINFPTAVSVMGYGKGRLISKSRILPQDRNNAYIENRRNFEGIEYVHNDHGPYFRYQDNIILEPWDSVERKSYMITHSGSWNSLDGFELISSRVKIDSGDSGAPLLDQNGNIVGIVEASLKPITYTDIQGKVVKNMRQRQKETLLYIDFKHDYAFEMIRHCNVVEPIMSITTLTAFNTFASYVISENYYLKSSVCLAPFMYIAGKYILENFYYNDMFGRITIKDFLKSGLTLSTDDKFIRRELFNKIYDKLVSYQESPASYSVETHAKKIEKKSSREEYLDELTTIVTTTKEEDLSLNKHVIDSLYNKDKPKKFTSWFCRFNRHTVNWVNKVIKDNAPILAQKLCQN